MRLSEAIRLGSMLHPQTFERMRQRDRHGDVVATCAFGAATAAGYSYADETTLTTELAPCPACGSEFGIVGHVMHLNDTHKWTRERIADWIETLESLTPVDAVREVVDPITVCAIREKSSSSCRSRG